MSVDATKSSVDPVWLLKAIASAIGIALVCGYAAACWLFYQGQWQFVLHPTRKETAPLWAGAVQGKVGAQEVHFSPDTSGTPQMVGWWIPAGVSGQYRHLTLLYLASGNGQVATSAPRLQDLHGLGLNIFAFDYRGFGQSKLQHPNQASMLEDASAALSYLTSMRAVPLARTIVYGDGVGGSLAVSLASANHTIPAVIFDHPEPNLLSTVRADPRTHFLPLGLLFRERFPLFPALAKLTTPKLILTRGSHESPTIAGDATNAAADPKITVALPDATPELYSHSISRFLDEYAPPTPLPEVLPTTGPSGG